MKTLFATKGFIPLLTLIFLNAFIDLGHKITIQNTIFKLYDGSEQIILTAIINSFILLPYILFFAPAGKFADRHNKAKVLRITSFAAFAIMLAIAFCYYMTWFWPAFFLTLLLALQSAYYGPAKFGYLKELIPNEQLKSANGFAQSLLMVAILSGVLVFSALFEMLYRDALTTPEQVIHIMTPLALVLCALAFIEALLSWRLPRTNAAQPTDTTPQTITTLLRSNILLPVIIGLCVFWSVGQMVLAVYPAFAKETLGITNAMSVQAMLGMIAIGIMVGSLLDGAFSKHFIEIKWLPVSGGLVIVIGVLLPITTSPLLATALFFVMGIAGGILVVPLNAILQFCSKPEQLGLTIAQANLLQNVAMLGCLLLTVIFSFFTIPAWQILFLIAALSAVGLSLMLKLMPQALAALRNPNPPNKVMGFNQLNGHSPTVFVLDKLDEALVKAIQHSYPKTTDKTRPQHWHADSVWITDVEHFQQATLPSTVQCYRAEFDQQGRLHYQCLNRAG